MPDDITPDPTSETPAPTAETPAEGAEKPAGTEGTPEGQKPAEGAEDKTADKVTELPDWAQKLITDLRGESANYRTRATSAEKSLSDAKTPEEVAAAVEEIKVENSRLARELMVTRVAAQFELPAELAEVLKGEDEAALKAHAQTLAKFAGTNEVGDLRGGLNPDENDGDESDPVKVAMAVRKRRY